MCIYCGTNKYRKIYEQHNGPIPKDSEGRSFHIHHIDSNRSNNNPDNLRAVSIEEHYQIHLNQGDLAACARLATLLNLSKDHISGLLAESNNARVCAGSHHLLGGEIQGRASRERVSNGTHNFLGGDVSRAITSKRIQEGTHHFLGPKVNAKRIADGNHHFVGDSNPSVQRSRAGTHHWIGDGSMQRNTQLRRVNDGSHHLLGGNIARLAHAKRKEQGLPAFLGDPNEQRRKQHKLIAEGKHFSQVEHTCPHCGKVGRGNSMKRHHFGNCKYRETQ